jgi:predicted nucleotide-binding protein
LLEKLEEHAQDAKYAVVLLTGDDLGGIKGGKEMKPRARQNVVFELGWFCGQIGRENVAVLYEPDVELPSDIDGLAYIGLNTEWRTRLVRELKASDFDVSLDRVG